METYWISAALIYAICGITTVALTAYDIGRGHGSSHGGSLRECSVVECGGRRGIYMVALVFWPGLAVAISVMWFVETFEQGGVNAGLPPENEHPTAKRLDGGGAK